MYATAADMLELYGAEEMAAIALPDHLRARVDGDLLLATVAAGDRSSWTVEQQEAAEACVTRIQGVLTNTSRIMDSYLGRRYALPLSLEVVAIAPLRTFCGDIARYLLQDDKSTGQSSARYEEAMVWLRDASAGRSLLPEPSPSPGAGSSPGMPLFVPGRTFFGNR